MDDGEFRTIVSSRSTALPRYKPKWKQMAPRTDSGKGKRRGIGQNKNTVRKKYKVNPNLKNRWTAELGVWSRPSHRSEEKQQKGARAKPQCGGTGWFYLSVRECRMLGRRPVENEPCMKDAVDLWRCTDRCRTFSLGIGHFLNRALAR